MTEVLRHDHTSCQFVNLAELLGLFSIASLKLSCVRNNVQKKKKQELENFFVSMSGSNIMTRKHVPVLDTLELSSVQLVKWSVKDRGLWSLTGMIYCQQETITRDGNWL